MSSVVVVALKMTFGLFWNKARTSLADNLKDGDVTSEKLRNFFTTELEEINGYIKSRSFCNLDESTRFIRDGLFYLDDVLHKRERDECCSELPRRKTAALSVPFGRFEYIVRFKKWLRSSDGEDDTISSFLDFDFETVDNLMEEISDNRWYSPNNFANAMDSFNNAFAKASSCFSDSYLPIEHRIMAAKLIIQSKLLMSLANLSHAKLCKEYLKDLHSLPAVVENFRSGLKEGISSHVNKDERRAVVLAVSMINFVVFQFLNCFTKDDMNVVNVYDWPQLEDGDWTCNPLIPDEKVFKTLRGKIPYFVSLKPVQSQIEGVDPKATAVTINGDLILFRQGTNPEVCELLKLSANKVEPCYTFEEFTLISFLAVGSGDRIYAFAEKVQSSAPTGHTMYDVFIFDEFDKKPMIVKDFPVRDGSVVLAPIPLKSAFAFCVPEQVVSKEETPRKELIQCGAVQGSLRVEIKMSNPSLATITDECKVIVADQSGYRIRIFEKDGQLIEEFELHEGEREACVAITFNCLTKEVVVVSRLENGFFLSAYSQTGERRHNVRLSHIGKDCTEIHLTSHRRGSIALITKEHVLFVQ